MESELRYLKLKVQKLEASLELIKGEVLDKLNLVLEQFFTHRVDQLTRQKRAIQLEENICRNLLSCCAAAEESSSSIDSADAATATVQKFPAVVVTAGRVVAAVPSFKRRQRKRGQRQPGPSAALEEPRPANESGDPLGGGDGEEVGETSRKGMSSDKDWSSVTMELEEDVDNGLDFQIKTEIMDKEDKDVDESPKPRVALDFEKRLEVISMHNNGKSLQEIANLLGVSKGQIHCTVKRKAEYERAVSMPDGAKRRRFKKR